jgi:hypothetical protein
MIRQKNLYEFAASLGNLGEVILVLRSLKRGPLEKWVLKSCIYRQSGITVRIPDADILIDLSEHMNLIRSITKKKRVLISLSRLGNELLRFENPDRDRLTLEQGKLLICEIIKNVGVANDFRSIFDLFSMDLNGDMLISCRDKRIGVFEDQILRLFQQLRIAYYREGTIVIEKPCKDWLVDKVLIALGIDKESLMKHLERIKKRGTIAEGFALEKEKERLTECGCPGMAKLVRRISEENVAAGYDILSFDGVESRFFPDRFIEVKGTSGEEVSFYLSKNELETARNIQDNYWIYCVLDVESEKHKKLVMIRNPYREIFRTKTLKATPVLWRVDIIQDTTSPGLY